MKLFILYIIIGITLLSCSERQEYVDKLEQAKSLLDEHPDSALQILDSLGTNEQDFSKSFRMRFQLLKLQAQNKAFVDFTSDSIAKDLVKYYDRNGNANEKMMSHYLLGCVYRDLGEAPKAVDCYLEATSKADTTDSDCDFYTLSAVFAQLSATFHKQLLPTYELEARKKAIYYAEKAGKLYYMTYSIERSVGSYLLLSKKDSAEIILKKALRFYEKYNYKEDALRVSSLLINLCSDEKGKETEVKEMIDKYDNYYKLFASDHELPPSFRLYYCYKGKYYEGLATLDSAEYYYRKSFYPQMPFTSKDSMYKGLLSVFSKRHQADSVAKYAKLYCEVNDSSIAKKDQNITAQMAAIYNYNRYQK